MKTMKKILIVILAFILPMSSMADEKSEMILKAMSTKFKSLTSYRLAFSASSAGEPETTGTLTVSGGKFTLRTPGYEVYYDGSTLWNYNKANKEVNVETLDPKNPNVLANPSKLLSIDIQEFDHKTISSSSTKQIVELTPRNSAENYTRIVLQINELTKNPEQAEIIDNSGGKITIKLSGLESNIAVSLTDFQFDTKKYKNIDIIDFR